MEARVARRRCVKETERRGSRAQISAHPDPFVFPQDPVSSAQTMLMLFSELWRANEITNKKALQDQHSCYQIKIDVPKNKEHDWLPFYQEAEWCKDANGD